MRLKALIVDDEPHARFRILKLLENIDEVMVIGECKNGTEAVETIERLFPDLVFLDIKMPDFDGFGVIKRLDPAHIPYIIFTTAFDEFAVKAFDIHAVDYLLKPIEKDRFKEAIERALRLHKADSPQFSRNILDIVSELNETKTEGLEIKVHGRSLIIHPEELMLAEADGNYVQYVTPYKTFLHRTTLNELEEQLKNAPFLRIHRSLLINTSFVDKTRYIGNNEYQFTLKNGKQVKSGRSYKKVIDQYLDYLQK